MRRAAPLLAALPCALALLARAAPGPDQDPVRAYEALARADVENALAGPADRFASEERLGDLLADVAVQRDIVVVRHADVTSSCVVRPAAAPGASLRATLEPALRAAGLELQVFCGALVVTPRGASLGEPPDGGELAARRASVLLPLAPLPLRAALEATGVPVQVEGAARARVDAAVVEFELEDAPLPVALTLLTHPFGLTWRRDGDGVRVVPR